MATDPQHGSDPDHRQRGQQLRHGTHQKTPERTPRPRALLQFQADIVHFHDQRHHAVDQQRDQDPDQHQRDRTAPETLLGEGIQRDHHNFR